MNRTALIALLAVSALACGDDDDGGTTADAAPADAMALQLGTSAQIFTFLNGKTIKMDGANIPSHPNGFNEDTNFGASSQCLISTAIAINAQQFSVMSALGTIEGAPTVGSTGTCNHALQNGNPLTFNSTTVLIENVKNNAECFDITVTYAGFTQEGRASIAADGKTVTMELFFMGQATNHRCAAGNPGTAGVILNAAAFTGNAKQVYVVQ
jgi:hypothetical protein